MKFFSIKKYTDQIILFKRFFLNIILFASFSLFILIATRFFIISFGRVNGNSMEPTAQTGQLFLINKFIYLFDKPQFGDIVQVIDPEHNKIVIKRIIAMPGDAIIIKTGKVYRIRKGDPIYNSHDYLPEPYLKIQAQTKPHPDKGQELYLIPEDKYFIMGDNRNYSTDSRDYGPIHRSRIIGKVVKIF